MPAAEKQLNAIVLSSMDEWGESVALAYVNMLGEKIDYLGDHAENGDYLEVLNLYAYLAQLRPKAYGHRILYRFDKATGSILGFLFSQTPLSILLEEEFVQEITEE